MKNRVKEYRKKRRLSQDELCVMANVAKSTIVRLEAEEDYNITVASLERIADALGVSVRSLFLSEQSNKVDK